MLWPVLYTFNKQVVSSDQVDPEAVVHDFYTQYLHNKQNLSVEKIPSLIEHLSPNFIAYLEDVKRSSMYVDPFLCAQDKPVGIITHQAEITSDRAIVKVTDSFPGHQFSIELLQIDGCWVIDQVICSP